MARTLGSVTLAAALLAGVAAPAAAVDPIPGTPIPPEPAAFTLPLPVTDAIVVDMYGSGGTQLLVVTGSDAGQGLAAVQAWTVGPVELGGSAVGYGEEVELRRSASVDELLSGRGRLGIDRDDMIKVRMGEPAKFLLVQRDGREVPLVATIGTDTEFDVPCCLTIWEVVFESGRLDLRLVADTQRFAAELVAADLDGDRTDEIVVTEGPINEAASDILRVSLLRWTGERYARTGFTIPFVASCCTSILDAGETDGAPGEEILLTGPGANLATGLLRLTLRDGVPVVERGEVSEVAAARAVTLEAGPAVVTADGFSWLRVWSWQRDGVPERAGQYSSRNTGGALAAAFGRGDATRILVVSSFPPSSVQVLSGDLWSGEGPALIFGRDTREGAFGGTVIGDDPAPLTPYFGVVPGGLPGAPDAFIFSGQMVRPLDSLGELADSVPLALLPGLEPMGRLGRSGEWMALLSGFTGFNTPRQALDLRWARPPATLRVVATASLMEPEANGADLAPTFHGAAIDPNHAQSLIVGDEAVDADVHGPPGSTVWWSTRGDAGSMPIGPLGHARIRLLDPAGPNAPEGSGATASIWVVTPAGHAYSGIWRIRVYRQPPVLAITDPGTLLNFSPTVSGETTPGATVTVNGEPILVADDGSFDASVQVGVLPTEMRVVAVDPVGNRSERVVSLVWPVDYRQLPFVPLAVGLTLGAALVLFLRKPGGQPSRGEPGESTFEEIGG